MIPDIKIVIDGQTLTAFSLIRITTTNQVNNIPVAKLTLTVSGDSLALFNKETQPKLKRHQPGNNFLLYVNNKVLFKGVIIRHSLILKGKDSIITLTVRHTLQQLVNTLRSQLFVNQDDESIIKQILGRTGVQLTFKQTSPLKVKHEQMVQFRCSDWSFIKKRLQKTNTWLLVDTDKATLISPQTLSSSKRHTIKWSAENDNIALYRTELRVDNQFNPESVSINYWDVKTQKLSQPAKASSAKLGRQSLSVDDVQTVSGSKWEIAFSHPLVSEEAISLAQSILNYQRISSVKGTFEVEGDAAYRPGDILDLSGFGQSFDGEGIITVVSHSIDQQTGWKTQLSLGELPENDNSASLIDGLHIGIVDKYKKDSESFDRIPVKIPALNLANNVLWARLGKPYASKDSGFCFYPEPGDEVIISFFDNDPCYPVILGAMHNPKNTSPVELNEKNNLKGLIVKNQKNQQQLLIDSGENKLIIGAGDNQLSLQQDKDVELSGKNNITVTAKAVKVDASNSVSLSGKSGVDIKGSKINLTQ